MTEGVATSAGAPDGEAAFGRVLLKLSGEALMGDLEYGADPVRIQAIAAQVAQVQPHAPRLAVALRFRSKKFHSGCLPANPASRSCQWATVGSL